MSEFNSFAAAPYLKLTHYPFLQVMLQPRIPLPTTAFRECSYSDSMKKGEASKGIE